MTVYCVCNDLRVNASTMVWILNSRDRLPKSQYAAVNDRVSKITVRPSEQRLSDTLHCCQPFGEMYSCNYHYSTIYIKGVLGWMVVWIGLGLDLRGKKYIFIYLFRFFTPLSPQFCGIVSSYYLVSSLQLPYGLGRDEGRKPCVLRNTTQPSRTAS